jgi:hypothetical protein
LFLNQFVCEANRRKLRYFYFDAFNAEWKKAWGEGSEQEFHWGIGFANRTVKPYLEPAMYCKVPVGTAFADVVDPSVIEAPETFEV